MKISEVQKDSIAFKHGIRAGEKIKEINDNPVRDIIDYRFYASDKKIVLKLEDNKGGLKEIKIKKKEEDDLGIILEKTKYKACKNRCIFCFIDQLPKGLRRTLYFKDEDFRLSFLFGNFITLTNLSDEDFKRIENQRISPLYISVHTTDEELRKKILGNQRIPPILPLIKRLTQQRIELHTQIVLLPNINDGKNLEKTVFDLADFYPQVKSLAIVPVGLTRFRKNLPEVKPVNKRIALQIVEKVDFWQRILRKRSGEGFIYAADEFFLMAGLDIPPSGYYDDFHQIENGVGMVRRFLDDFKSEQKKLPKRSKRKLSLILVTGKLALKIIKEKIEKRLNKIENLKVRTVEIENNFLGRSVTISGLLSGRDIFESLRKMKFGEIVILPPDCINSDGLFLDDLTPDYLEKKLKRKVVVGSYNILETIDNIITNRNAGL
ncbi:MAG: hypothetical protein AMJ90_01175 [candidate division Zixibacteria bacterium SM23_73_2]|nr:MAG: hypothetical protein AMJ90_01175 [candidate division Zixibacteria bacterium SM23_73_2]